MGWGRGRKLQSEGSEVKVQAAQSCRTLQPHGLYNPWNSPGQNTGVGSLALLQGLFPTQGSNPGLPHCRRIFLPAEPQGKPKNSGVGSLSLLQGIFPTQESNRGLLHCRQILYQLSYQGKSLISNIWVTKLFQTLLCKLSKKKSPFYSESYYRKTSNV